MISDVLWSLPVHWHVVVKENPKMKYKRNRRFYKTIKDIPRTHLASPDLSSTAILKKSSAVVSVGGTVTVEAALLGKPAFCSGTPPFHFFAKSTGPDIYPSLNKIVSILKDSPSRDEERLSKNMKRHLQSTFVAKYALEDFRDDVQHMTVDSSQENAEAYASYILECISD
jgi:lipid A disaccharide synthetase